MLTFGVSFQSIFLIRLFVLGILYASKTRARPHSLSGVIQASGSSAESHLQDTIILLPHIFRDVDSMFEPRQVLPFEWNKIDWPSAFEYAFRIELKTQPIFSCSSFRVILFTWEERYSRILIMNSGEIYIYQRMICTWSYIADRTFIGSSIQGHNSVFRILNDEMLLRGKHLWIFNGDDIRTPE